MVRPRKAQAFHGNENILVIAPRDLQGASVKLDGEQVGYLWSLDHMRSTAVDVHYRPPIPKNIAQDASVTRVFVGVGHHTLLIESRRFAPILRAVDNSIAEPTVIEILPGDLKSTLSAP
jgi:hypothetical protein